jgi:hypothetical protein
VSRHWKPYAEPVRIMPGGERTTKRWPAGATVGLAIVALSCIGIAAALYHVAGPRNVFEGPSD